MRCFYQNEKWFTTRLAYLKMTRVRIGVRLGTSCPFHDSHASSMFLVVVLLFRVLLFKPLLPRSHALPLADLFIDVFLFDT